MIFQIFLIIFAVIALWKTYQQYQKDHVSLHWFWIWVLLWAAVIFVSLYPATTDMVAEFVGVERGADLIVYIAVVVLLFGFARIIVRQEKQRQELTELVRKMAIEHAEKHEDKS